MNIGGGEAADQMVRMLLSGTEVVIRLSGSALKNLLALTLALARNHKKLSGKVNLGKMLRETQDLRQFSMTPEQDKKFIVTDPADIVRTPEYPPQDSRDIVQHNVPELPPPRIVDPFKVIHINNKHRMGLAHVAFQKTQIYQMLNRHPIVASRETIPVRRFFLNQHGLLAFRHTRCPLYAVGRILSTSTLIAATPTGCRNRAPNPYSRTSGFSCGCDGLTLFKQ